MSECRGKDVTMPPTGTPLTPSMPGTPLTQVQQDLWRAPLCVITVAKSIVPESIEESPLF